MNRLQKDFKEGVRLISLLDCNDLRYINKRTKDPEELSELGHSGPESKNSLRDFVSAKQLSTL